MTFWAGKKGQQMEIFIQIDFMKLQPQFQFPTWISTCGFARGNSLSHVYLVITILLYIAMLYIPKQQIKPMISFVVLLLEFLSIFSNQYHEFLRHIIILFSDYVCSISFEQFRFENLFHHLFHSDIVIFIFDCRIMKFSGLLQNCTHLFCIILRFQIHIATFWIYLIKEA